MDINISHVAHAFNQATNTQLPKFVSESIMFNANLLKELFSKIDCNKNNPTKVFMYTGQCFLKSLSWLPSFAEFVIYATFIALLFIIFEIYHSNQIDARVRKESRCARTNNDANNKVTAVDDSGNALYTVDYDLNKKSYTIGCEGDRGDHTNEYSVNVYNFQNKNAKQVRTSCRQTFNSNPDSMTYYTGDPKLIRFMTNTSDTSYFN